MRKRCKNEKSDNLSTYKFVACILLALMLSNTSTLQSSTQVLGESPGGCLSHLC